MLWLLPLQAGPARVRMDPGLHYVPGWYDEAEWHVLVEILRRVLDPAPIHALVLPVEAIGTEGEPRAPAGANNLIALRGQPSAERTGEIHRWARDHRHHVLVEA